MENELNIMIISKLNLKENIKMGKKFKKTNKKFKNNNHQRQQKERKEK